MADQPFIKLFVILMLIAILVSLGSAFFSLFIRGKSEDTNAVKALTIRVALSVTLFIVLMVLASLGIIKPN